MTGARGHTELGQEIRASVEKAARYLRNARLRQLRRRQCGGRADRRRGEARSAAYAKVPASRKSPVSSSPETFAAGAALPDDVVPTGEVLVGFPNISDNAETSENDGVAARPHDFFRQPGGARSVGFGSRPVHQASLCQPHM